MLGKCFDLSLIIYVNRHDNVGILIVILKAFSIHEDF